MAAKAKNKSFMPGSTWEVVKKVVRAYHAAASKDDPSGEDIAELAGLPRPVISTNTNFLREIGILNPDAFRLTEMGSRFAMGLVMEDEAMATAALSEAARSSSQVRDLLNILRARGPLAIQSFRNEIMLKVGLLKDSWQAPFVKTLLDFLLEARQIEVRSDDTVTALLEPKKLDIQREQPDIVRPAVETREQPVTDPSRVRIPLPLGPNRLAHLELPPDWEQKELRKLIKILEIALGDDGDAEKK